MSSLLKGIVLVDTRLRVKCKGNYMLACETYVTGRLLRNTVIHVPRNRCD